MLQVILQENILFYAMAVICAWGVISQMVRRSLYGGLMKDASHSGVSKKKFIRQLRQRYQSSQRLKQDTMNTAVFVQRNLMEYRFLGTSLHGWKRMGQTAMVLCAALGAGGWYISQMPAVMSGMQQNYLMAAAAAELMILLAYGLMDTGYAKQSLEIVLQDNLENSYALHASGVTQTSTLSQKEEAAADSDKKGIYFESENGSAAKETANGESEKTIALAAGKKKSKNGSGRQKDKRERKESFFSKKQGMRETAAASAETQKEKNTRILRQMDPDEQEKVIREVLKEFLS